MYFSCLTMRSPIFDNVFLKSGKITLQHYDIKVGPGLDKNVEFMGLVGTETIARIVNSENPDQTASYGSSLI